MAGAVVKTVEFTAVTERIGVIVGVKSRTSDGVVVDPGIYDAVTIALVVTMLVIDAIALASMRPRLADESGLDPNRLAVPGAKSLMFAHLAWILTIYLRVHR